MFFNTVFFPRLTERSLISNTGIFTGQLAGETEIFSPAITTVGRIISSTAGSRRRRREFIISIGRQDALRVGDVLDVVRGDTYVTVDPENPVVVLQNTIGKVKVVSVQEKNAVVRVVKDNRKDPIQLKDTVIKVTGPRS